MDEAHGLAIMSNTSRLLKKVELSHRFHVAHMVLESTQRANPNMKKLFKYGPLNVPCNDVKMWSASTIKTLYFCE